MSNSGAMVVYFDPVEGSGAILQADIAMEREVKVYGHHLESHGMTRAEWPPMRTGTWLWRGTISEVIESPFAERTRLQGTWSRLSDEQALALCRGEQVL